MPIRMTWLVALVLSIGLGANLVGCSTAAHAQDAAAVAAIEKSQPTLREFSARMTAVESEADAIIKSADAAAARTVAHPDLLMNIPYGLQGWFAEELLNRAGGLANALPSEERPKRVTPNDILLLAVRSWESDGPKIAKAAAEWRAKGSYIVVFGSRAGAPTDLQADAIIDNGAKTGSNNDARINAIVDVTNAWMWCCEYNAALTRRGFWSPVLHSIFMPGSTEHNKKYQSGGRNTIYPLDKPIVSGSLMKAYRARVQKMIADLAAEKTRGGIAQAGKIIAEKLRAGRTVYISTCTHFLLNEINIDGRTSMKPLRAVWKSKSAMKDVSTDDVVLWMGYYGMSTPFEDYGGMLRNSGVQVIRSFAGKGSEADQKDTPLLHIAQPWDMPDAEVDVPFAPGKMAPVSGVIQALMWRMIEDEVIAQK